MKEISLTPPALKQAQELFSNPEKIQKDKLHDACEFSKLVATRIRDKSELSASELLEIIIDILRRLGRGEKLQSGPDVANPLWKIKSDELVLTVLPRFAHIYERALPKNFAEELTEALIERVKPAPKKEGVLVEI
jgi:hypothetical protein